MDFGLALAGGGVKGAAHIGVLKVLEEENIKCKCIAGTSSGSIVAALYAIGYKPEEIYELFKKYCKEIKYVEFRNIIKLLCGLVFKRKIIIDGLNSGKKLEKIIRNACAEKNIYNINQVKMDLIIPMVNLKNGQTTICSSTKPQNRFLDDLKYIYDIDVAKAVRASCSYPGVFSPVKEKNTKFIDGGIRENVAWKEIGDLGIQKTFCVIFEKEDKIKNINDVNILEVILNSLDIMSHELLNYEMFGTDYILKIKTKNISLLDTDKIDDLFELGYNETKNRIEEIKNKFN